MFLYNFLHSVLPHSLAMVWCVAEIVMVMDMLTWSWIVMIHDVHRLYTNFLPLMSVMWMDILDQIRENRFYILSNCVSLVINNLLSKQDICFKLCITLYHFSSCWQLLILNPCKFNLDHVMTVKFWNKLWKG